MIGFDEDRLGVDGNSGGIDADVLVQVSEVEEEESKGQTLSAIGQSFRLVDLTAGSVAIVGAQWIVGWGQSGLGCMQDQADTIKFSEELIHKKSQSFLPKRKVIVHDGQLVSSSFSMSITKLLIETILKQSSNTRSLLLCIICVLDVRSTLVIMFFF